jgi:hypothetical protein
MKTSSAATLAALLLCVLGLSELNGGSMSTTAARCIPDPKRRTPARSRIRMDGLGFLSGV